MTLTEEQGGFDLEKARASIAHYRIENPSNVDTESALKELVDQANLAEDALAEIARLRADLEQAEICIRARLEVIDQQAARIKELEDAHKRSGVKYAKIINELRSSVYAKIPSLQKQWDDVLAEGKIGPDAKPRLWQITEERKAAIDRGLQFLEWSYAKNSALDTKEQITVLRAMLDEAL